MGPFAGATVPIACRRLLMLHVSRNARIEMTNAMLPSQRAQFDMPREVCYLNAASYSPLPLKTQEAARAAVARKGQPWKLPASFANEIHERTRKAAARLINADSS